MLECPWQQRGDFFNGDVAGELTRQRAAHAVAHGEGEVCRFQRGLAGFPEAENLPRIKLQTQE